MSKFDDFKGKSEKELKGMVSELKRELLNLRFQQASGELENTSRFRAVRHDIARAQTALSQLKENKAA